MGSLSSDLSVLREDVQPGQALADVLTAKRINAIQGAIAALARGDNIYSGLNITKKGVAGGVMIGSTARGGGGGSVTITHPFQLTDASVAGGSPVAKVLVNYGTLNDVDPTASGAGLLTLTGDGTHTIYLECEVDDNGALVAVVLASSASGKPADLDYFGCITLGEADVTSDAITEIRQAVTHSLRMSMCGRVYVDPDLTARGTYEFWGI